MVNGSHIDASMYLQNCALFRVVGDACVQFQVEKFDKVLKLVKDGPLKEMDSSKGKEKKGKVKY
jgi:hypothetical protein